MTQETHAWMANDHIIPHIPPSSPHFDGLWDAGVKSVKRHLLKTFEESLLHIEEMYTALAQVETCLNSRHLAPLSSDASGEDALTLAHFLSGSFMFALPDKTPENVKELRRWQLTQKVSTEFWNRWHQEYPSRLQERPKW
ncbi:uncharacterized protein LOC119648495 [Hermetia illucens]|uniref:uncharacterized protein LOC119648495 n=1 Tax=Hermetia illucens TaxID=343691 RepID=UPI0018CBFBFC|nr:uncharacterized protein LOC119648495 [Hermetia illucens]